MTKDDRFARAMRDIAAAAGVDLAIDVATTPVGVQLCIDAVRKAQEVRLPPTVQTAIENLVVALFAGNSLRPPVVELTKAYGELPGRNVLDLLVRSENERVYRDDDDGNDD